MVYCRMRRFLTRFEIWKYNLYEITFRYCILLSFYSTLHHCHLYFAYPWVIFSNVSNGIYLYVVLYTLSFCDTLVFLDGGLASSSSFLARSSTLFLCSIAFLLFSSFKESDFVFALQRCSVFIWLIKCWRVVSLEPQFGHSHTYLHFTHSK